jgi:hypothetical protein
MDGDVHFFFVSSVYACIVFANKFDDQTERLVRAALPYSPEKCGFRIVSA